MAEQNPEFDAYIAKSAEFARPILTRIRALFHRACPQIEEKLKWSCPSFEYKGIVGGMAAFKQHVRFTFWKGRLLGDPDGVLEGDNKTDMSGLTLQKLSDLPSDKVFVAFIKEAVRLNEEGIKSPSKPRAAKAKPLAVPAELAAALKKNRKAAATFENFSTSNRNEYVAWVGEAKQDATRRKRLATAVKWLAEGKPRNWKYMKEWR